MRRLTKKELEEQIKILELRLMRLSLRSGRLSPRQLYLMSGGRGRSSSKDEMRSRRQTKMDGRRQANPLEE